eukprot:TRINITY_DN72487_c0_g1_i1.p1 TRINITY_DN72487_c0_g1~~TRINITY_DN72487_c0_g1_i1.p1  ORF type:complete len:153 (+),score=12.47 TRINITY_DN72487_c0_g1_i1:144-602(+)
MAQDHPFMFEDSFEVSAIDNSRFERAGRLDMASVGFGSTLELDINNIIYPVSPGEQLHVAITSNVSPADNPRKLNTAYDHDRRLLGRSIMDEFEYVMYGKVYKTEVKKGADQAVVHASYGGLLMKLTATASQLKDFHVSDAIYLMMRKVPSS